mmetsp:Transcript_19378/g.28419  ORF Transcript_19378/g.28419 Transcript_19378/m.28419 type:complete len:179 (-) Transcript_19378:237-773(-)
MKGITSSPVKQKKPQMTPKLDDEAMEELTEAFRLFDTTSTGSVDAIEIKALFIALGFKSIKKAEVKQLLSNIDKTGTDTVTFNEFVAMVSPKILSRDPKEEIGRIFDLFDEEGNGVISFENLKKVSAELGENYTDKDMRQMVEEADRTGNGGIRRDDFYTIVMKGKNGDPLDYLSDDE